MRAWVCVCVCTQCCFKFNNRQGDRDKPGNTETLDVKHEARKMQAWMRGM